MSDAQQRLDALLAAIEEHLPAYADEDGERLGAVERVIAAGAALRDAQKGRDIDDEAAFIRQAVYSTMRRPRTAEEGIMRKPSAEEADFVADRVADLWRQHHGAALPAPAPEPPPVADVFFGHSGDMTDPQQQDPQPVKYLPLYDERPTTRGECADVPRPCPFASCHHHLLWHIRHRSDLPGGGPKLARPTMTDDELVEALLSLHPGDSCALDVADRGGLFDEEVAEILGLSKQRVQQIEAEAQFKVRVALAVLGVRKADVDG